MANQKMGFEGQLFYGAAGSTAAILLTNVVDITLSGDVERGSTTVRGDSTKPPIQTSRVTALTMNIEWTMINDSADAQLEALRVAAHNGQSVALRGIDRAGGKGPDADYSIGISEPWPLEGEQVVTFTGEPDRSLREPQTYV